MVHDDAFLDNYLLLYIKLGDVQSNSSEQSLADVLERMQRKDDSTLDGADELKYEDSIFNLIVQKCNFTTYPIIVWARNWKIKEVSDTYDFVFDINGFNESQLKMYFQKFFNEEYQPFVKPINDSLDQKKAEKSEILFQTLKTENLKVFKICNNPLMACLVAGIWEERETDIISNKYSIFDQTIQILLSKAGIVSESNVYFEILDYCSKLAFENLLNNKKISINEILQKSDFIGGLLIPVKKRSVVTHLQEFTFIHFFFQEYLTARYILNLYKEGTNNEMNIQSLKSYFDKFKNLFLLKNVFSFIQEINSKVFSQMIEENENILTVLETDQRIIEVINTRDKNSIELEEISLSSTIIDILFDCYQKNVKVINLKFVKMNLPHFIESCVNQLEDKLEILKLYGGVEELIKIEILENLMRKMKKLKVLNITNISFNDNIIPVDKGYMIFANQYRQMTALQINNCNTELDSEVIKNFLELNKQIEVLELKGNVVKESYENSFLTVLLSLQNMTHLKLPRIVHKKNIWRDQKLSENKKNLINLKSLDMGENCIQCVCIANFFEQVSQSSKYLYSLCLRKSRISSQVVNILSNSYNKWDERQVESKTENLQIVNLCWKFQSCEFELNSNDIDKLFNGMFYFKQLDISNINAALVIKNLFKSKSLERIESLILRNCHITPKELAELGFCNCDIESQVETLVGEAIGMQPELFHLDLSNNLLGTEIGKIVQCIDLSNCGLGSDIGNVVGAAIGKQKGLTVLQLSNNPLGTEVGKNIFENIKGTCTKLACIDLSNCGLGSDIGNTAGKAIGKLSDLTVLQLSNNPLGTEVGKNIFENIKGTCTKLIQIAFDNCGFGSEIGSIVGEAIGKQTQLSLLYLQHNEIGTIVGKYIFENIKFNCTKLSKIAFDNCGFDSAIGPIVGEAIGKQTQLTELFLQDNKFGTIVGKHIFENIKFNCTHLSTICLNNCGLQSEIGPIVGEVIGKQTELTGISLTKNPIGTEVGIGIFENIKRNCTKLSSICLNNCGIESQIGLVIGEAIGKQKHLTALDLSNNPLGTEVGKNLIENLKANCTRLSEIYLNNCGFDSNIGPAIGEAIGKQKQLSVLDIGNNAVGSVVGRNIFENIKDNCKQLIKINLIKCDLESNIGEAIVEAIGKQKQLSQLNLSDNPLVLLLLAKSMRLKWLNLEGNKLGSEVGKSIFENIKLNCSDLSAISLASCELESNIGCVIGDAIGRQTNLTTLHLYNNSLGTEVGRHFFENIKLNCNGLTTINLASCAFESNIGCVIGDAIGKQKGLKWLNLEGNKLGSEVGKSIFENIKLNCSDLSTINLASCELESNIGCVIGDAIGKQTGLQWLKLENNKIGSEVGKSIFENIKLNCRYLITISFASCELESNIGCVIGDAIGKQRELTYLDISHNNWDQKLEDISLKILRKLH
ncbi:DgyrCDS14885 [Dimorphilus gyrociliatus]|uniref:DgyrCDS14885 n=1 Tax=Dimorphilus gyrociliatus TaxID=2664684 RepID=A0A7I8WFA4_9ANNE|nr:DgyrCDS14885 [Dimorphilus gyrociliatus]